MFLFFVFMGLIVSPCCSFLAPNGTETVLVPSKRAISPRALSGSTTSTHGTKYKLHLEWTATQDKSKLTSTITATFYIELLSATASDTGMYNQYPSGSSAPTLTITIGGTTALSTVKTFDFRSQSAGYTDAKGSGSATVSHDADGSKSVTISASLATHISTQGTLSISTTAALDTLPVSVTIKFDGNGGTASKTSTTVTYKETYGTLATATREGYTFNGWYTAKSGGTKVEAGTTVKVTSTQTLYAQWTVNRLTITFTNPGGEDINPITEDYGTEITLPNATKTGHTFVCWLDEGENVFAETSMPAKNVTLHPQYYANNYTITINIDGNATEITKPYGTAIILPVPTAIPDGYSFGGWEDANRANYSDVYVVSGNNNLTVIWTPNVYTVSFMVDSGKTIVYNVSYGSFIVPPTVEKSVYVLRGWCLGHENCSTVVDFDKETMPSEDIELYGKWELITDCVEIIFETNDLERWKNYINEIAEFNVTSEFSISAYVDDNAKTHVIVKFENINNSVEFYRICNEYAHTDDNIASVGYTTGYNDNFSVLISPMTGMIFYTLVNI